MIGWLLAVAFSNLGIGVVGLGLIAALIASIVLGAPVHLRWAIAVALAVFLSYGASYRAGVAACEARVAAAVADMHMKDQVRIDELKRELDGKEAAYQTAIAEVANYKNLLDQLPDHGAGDLLTKGDADAINR